jgi:transketolase
MIEEIREGTRDGYGRALLEVARQDKRVVALDCDLGRSTRSFRITEADPQRFFEMGIAEQDMISTAVGLAREGKVVFANSFAVFIVGRAFDQIRQQVSLACTNVKLCGSSAGITQGPDGATHQSIMDVNLMRGLPNIVVVVPADGRQAVEAVWAVYQMSGPVYLRLSRLQTTHFVPEDLPFKLGKAQVLREGKHVALVGTGPVLQEVLAAAERLEIEGVSAAVYNFHTVKPLDMELVKTMCFRFPVVISVEEHSVIGGLGTALAEVMMESVAAERRPVFRRIGIRDTYGESGTAEELLRKHGLDAEGIVETVRQVLTGRQA